ncbi:MAG: hypothetical protein D6705_17700 [Deltaproteobacteria bacterium]|nr:MAG: hypothetical protein D6705_17700 [Deltaproteobacteria bacterium]
MSPALYRLKSLNPAVTVDPAPVEIAPGEEVELSASIDLAALPSSEITVPITVLTEEGALQWNLQMAAPRTGYYVGALSLGSGGRFLGISSLAVNLEFNDDFTISGQTFRDESLLWPNDVLIRGTWDEEGNVVLHIDDVLPADNPGGSDVVNPLGREVGRQVTLTGTADFELGTVSGSVSQTLTGLTDLVIELPGSFQLTRGQALREPSGSAQDYGASLPLSAPKDAFPPDLDVGACENLGTTFGTAETMDAMGPVAECAACAGGLDCSPNDAKACAMGLLDAGFLLDDPTVLSSAALVGAGGQVEPPDVDFWAQCTSDGAPTYVNGRTCVDREAVTCAAALTRRAAELGAPMDPKAFGGAALDAMMAEASIGTVIGMQKMVDAVFAFQEGALGDVLTAELTYLESALDLRTRPLMVAASPGFLDILDLVGKQDLLGARGGADLETGLAVATQWADTLGLWMRVRSRSETGGDEALQIQAQYAAAWMNAVGAMWTVIVDLYELEDEALEVNLFGDSMRELSAAFERLRPGTNAFGYPDSYVPIVLTPEQAAMGASNFLLVAEQASSSIAFYKSRLEEADAARMAFEEASWSISQEAKNVAQRFDDELGDLCGWKGDVPDYEACGTTSGMLFQYKKDAESAAVAVQQAAINARNNDWAMETEEWRWSEILANFADLQNFIEVKNGEATKVKQEAGEARSAKRREYARFTCTQIFEALEEQMEIHERRCAEEITTKLKPNPGYFFGPDDPAGAAIVIDRCKKEKAAMRAQAERDCKAAHAQADVENDLDEINTQEAIELMSINAEIDAQIRQSQINEQGIEHEVRIREFLRTADALVLESNQASIRSQAAQGQLFDGFNRVLSLMQRRQKALQRLEQSPANPLTNPKFLQAQLEYGRNLLRWREQAARAAYLAGRALEYHINQDVAQIEMELVPARSATEMEDALQCFITMYQDYSLQAGTPQQFVTDVSVRDDLLRMGYESTDEVLGQPITPAERFRAFLFSPDHFMPDGSLEFPIAITLTENSVFSSLACNDVIESLQIKVVGDFLGDNEIDFFLSHGGEGALRRCDAASLAPPEQIVRYSFGPRTSLLQAGANDFGLAQANAAYAGWPVGGAEWKIRIPSGSVSPANEDLNLEAISDIVLRVTHRAASVGALASPSCN